MFCAGQRLQGGEGGQHVPQPGRGDRGGRVPHSPPAVVGRKQVEGFAAECASMEFLLFGF